MAWMYILEFAEGSYYVGSTKYLKYRLSKHQAGESVKHTSHRLPVQLVYTEEYDHVADAFAREKQI